MEQPSPKETGEAVSMIYDNMPEWYQTKMAEEWHHKIDAEHKIILQCIYRRETPNGKTYYTCRIEQTL